LVAEECFSSAGALAADRNRKRTVREVFLGMGMTFFSEGCEPVGGKRRRAFARVVLFVGKAVD
jgi:hypothetical protein